MRIDPESKLLQAGKNRKMIVRSLTLVRPETFVDENRERNLSRLAALLPSHSTRSHIPGIGDLGIRFLETFEVGFGKIHLSPHGNRDGPGKAQRNRLYRPYIAAHVIAHITVAARQRPHEHTFLIIKND